MTRLGMADDVQIIDKPPENLYYLNRFQQFSTMLSEQRHQAILELLNREGSITVAHLVNRFDVSDMTVRRDLELLARKGLLRRVHGGAVSARGRSFEPAYLLRSASHQEEKARIGQAAAALVEDGDSIALDVGTTTLEVARRLVGRRNLTIITPSFHIASLLAEQPDIRIILTGGIVRPGELSLVGELAQRALQDFFVDKLFLGIGGLHLEAGLTEFNLEDALVKKAMLGRAKETIVVADATKFGRVAFAAVGPLQTVKRIVTDSLIDADARVGIQALGIDLLIV
jgi:DeoR/GlpR family transcriptional regulator of sugar metabolism